MSKKRTKKKSKVNKDEEIHENKSDKSNGFAPMQTNDLKFILRQKLKGMQNDRKRGNDKTKDNYNEYIGHDQD